MTHLATLWKAIVLSYIINYLFITIAEAATPSSARLDHDAVDASSVWGTEEEEEFMPSFQHVKKLFNEGKPFFVDKDPLSGQFDFNHKKSAGVVDDYKSPAEELIPLRTNEITPNIHDFLHLPVKYSSSKSVYPLVSTSYANTKYQGSNKDQEGSNHKEYTNVEIQKRPNFFTSNAIFPFEKSTTAQPSSQHTKTISEKQHVTTPRPIPTVTTFKPSFPRRPSTPFPTRGSTTKDQNLYRPTTIHRWEPSTPASTTTVPSTYQPSTSTHSPLTPTFPTTTPLKTTYSPTVPSTTRPTTRKYDSPTEKVATTTTPPPLPMRTTTTIQVEASPSTTPTSKPLVFPTESMSLLEMLNNFADDTNNPNVNTISANASPFQKPSGFKPNKDVVAPRPTTTTTANPMVNFNDYVKFDIHPPNMITFNNNEPVASSMNNIKISPDQNVASFVLGSKQSFGVDNSQGGGGPQGPKIVGQVFNAPISGGAVSIRFPSKEEESRFESLPVITGAYKNVHDMPNGHSAPFGFEPPSKHHLSFPPPSSGNILTNGQDSKMVGTKIVFENSNPSQYPPPPPPREVLPLKSNPNQRPILTAQNDMGQPPEQIRNRPPYPTKYFDYSQQGQSPPPPKSTPPNRPDLYDPSLPNILPQFRPSGNSKPPHGYPGHQYKETGAYRPYTPNTNRRVFTPGSGPPGLIKNRPFPGSAPPPTLQQQGPPMRNYHYQTNRFQSKMAPAPPPPPTKEQIEANRRVYKFPQTQPLYAAPPRVASDRVFNVRPHYPQQHEPMNMNPLNQEYSNSNKFTQMDPLTLKNNFIDEDLRPPQQELMAANGELKLEPVVTLQMIQTKKGGQGAKLSTLHADIPNSNGPTGTAVNGTDKPVYVVYPVVVGHRGEPPTEPELPSGGAYQNTPFTVVHHEQQAPILTTLQKHLSVPKSPNRTNFPYQLEQPDPNSASELDSKTRRKDSFPPSRDGQESIYNIGELPVPPQIHQPKILNKPNDSISAKLPIATDRPAIAIAYTPTTPRIVANHHNPPLSNHQSHYFSMPNYDSAVIPEIHQTPMKEVDSFSSGDYYEKDFQAPFHPSVNLDGISDSFAGWAILDRTTNRVNTLEQNNGGPSEIDRRDKNKDDLIIGDYSNDLKDPSVSDNFQPELEGGFRPIIPPHLMSKHESMDMEEEIPVALKQVSEQKVDVVQKSSSSPLPTQVMAKDTAVGISAESSLLDSDKFEDKEVETDPEEMVEYEDEMEEVTEEVPVKENPVIKQKVVEKEEIKAEVDKLNMPTTTEKVMSFEDALSAIFGLNDEGFEEEIKNQENLNSTNGLDKSS